MASAATKEVQGIESAVNHEDVEQSHPGSPPKEIPATGPTEDPHVSWSTFAAVFFMGLSYVPAIGTGLLLPLGILQQIGQTLGDTENILWMPGGWSIASAVSFSIAGGLSDIFGRRWVLIFGQFLTLVGAIISGTANTTLIVSAGMTIIGFGAGIIFVSYPGITELLPNKYRGIGLGWTEFCINVPWGCLSVYLATQLYVHAGWRWSFYITIMYAAVCVAGTALFYFPPSRPLQDYDRSRWQEFKDLDFVGLGLFAGGLTILLVGITYIGRADYSVALVASTISIGGVVFFASFIYDFTIPKNPIFPRHLFAMFREFSVYLVMLFLAGMNWQAVATLAPQATLYLFTSNPLEIGIIMIPLTMSGVLGGWILPSLLHVIKHVRAQIIVALVIQTVFTASYAAALSNFNKSAWMGLGLLGQSAFTWVTTLAYVASGLLVPHEELGVSAGLLGTFRSAGGSVGNAVFSTIMTALVNRDLGNNIAAAAIGAGFSPEGLEALIPATILNAVGVPGVFAGVPGITPAIESAASGALKATYASTFKVVFLSTIPVGIIALILAFFVRDPSHLLNNLVAVHQEKEVLAALEHHGEKQREPHAGTGT